MKTGSSNKILQAVGVGLIVNVILTILKLTSGIVGHSQALVSDGLNSFSDVFISLMLLVILRIATKKPDHDHPYGHEKFEGIAYFLLGIIFLITAIFIGNLSIVSIIDYIKNPSTAIKPDILTLIISTLSLLIKIALFRYFLIVSKKYESPTLKADAKNHLLDAWATLFTVIGIALSQFNLVIFDYIASIIIGLFILRLAIQILIESVAYLVDQAPSDEVIKRINEVIQSVSGVIKVDDLKVRKHMTQKYVDVEIAVQSSLTLEAAHKIAESVHHKVEAKFPEVIHCMVHVNPHK
ncbi:MAG: cation diffusion facilitator family transporter [Acholeplasmataceae bacterium]|nr:cation diffusion facilitator family transporter [Acholeplasmataceae bacterium]